MTRFEETTKIAESLEILARGCKDSGLAEVPACMRRTFCKGHQGVPLSCLGLWSLAHKKGDDVAFLTGDGTIVLGLWVPREEGVSAPYKIQRLSTDEFLALWG